MDDVKAGRWQKVLKSLTTPLASRLERVRKSNGQSMVEYTLIAVLVALVAAHVFFALWRLFGRETQAALVLALSHQIGDGAFFVAGFVFFVMRQFIARRRRHVRFQQIGIGPNMRVGIEDFVTVTRHGCLLNAAQIAQ